MKAIFKVGVFCALAFAMACVPARKFEELQARYTQADDEREGLRAEVQSLSAENKELKVRVNDLVESLKNMELDTIQKGRAMRRLETQYLKINNLNTELLDKYAKLQKGSEIEFSRVLRELDELKEELQKREDDLNILETELATKRKDMTALSAELDAREEKLRELQDLIEEKDLAAKNLRKQISDALLGYKDKGLTVEQRGGKIYLSLDAKLLFSTGSTTIDTAGVRALKDVAKALENAKDVEILVEGHTDSDDFKSAVSPKNNWELSVLRATSVVQILLENSEIDPKTLVPAGRSKYLPVDSQDKARNRRIEIILSPNLDKLYGIIDKSE